MFGIKLIILLVFLGGLIAYLGDLFGRKIGKKKITIFGLRPRHSAVIITITGGVLIVAVTLLTLSIISKEARVALFGMEKLQKELNLAKKNIKETTEKLENAKVNLKNKNKELHNLMEQINKEREQLVFLKKERDEAIIHREKIAKDLEISRKEEERLKSVQIELTDKIENLRRQGENIFEQLKKVREELASAEEEKKKIEEEKKKVEIKLKETKAGRIIIPANYEVSRLNINTQDSIQQIREQVIQELVSINKWAYDKGARGNERGEGIVVWEDQISKLLEDIANRKGKIIVRTFSYQNTMEGEPLYLRFEIIENKMIISKGEKLSEGYIDPKSTQQEIEKKMLLLLKEARDFALERGLMVGREGEIGGISAIKFYNIVNLIKKSEAKLNVSVITTKNIYINDTLEVDFRIKEVKEK